MARTFPPSGSQLVRSVLYCTSYSGSTLIGSASFVTAAGQESSTLWPSCVRTKGKGSAASSTWQKQKPMKEESLKGSPAFMNDFNHETVSKSRENNGIHSKSGGKRCPITSVT